MWAIEMAFTIRPAFGVFSLGRSADSELPSRRHCSLRPNLMLVVAIGTVRRRNGHRPGSALLSHSGCEPE